MSRTPSHPSDEALLRGFDDDQPPHQRAELETHVARCEPCRTRLAAIRSLVGEALREGVSEEWPADAVDRLRGRLSDRLTDRAGELDRSWRFRLASRAAAIPPAAVVAATLAIVVLGGYLVLRGRAPGIANEAQTAAEPGALPIRALTPGATARVTADDLCEGRGPSREEIAPSVRLAVLRDYGMEGLPDAEYELDYLITPELGGSSDRRNLWPERYGSRLWNARVKDQLEDLLPHMVCDGRVDLATAQRDIALDWIAAYKRYFHTDAPLPSTAALDDVEPGRPVLVLARLSGGFR